MIYHYFGSKEDLFTAVMEEAYANNLEWVEMVRSILDRGVALGVFRDDVDAQDLNITIAAIGYHYLTNRHTGAVIHDTDMMAPARLAKRPEFNLMTIHRLLHV